MASGLNVNIMPPRLGDLEGAGQSQATRNHHRAFRHKGGYGKFDRSGTEAHRRRGGTMHRRRILMSLVASLMLSPAFATPGRAQEASKPLLSPQKLEQLVNFALSVPIKPVREDMSRNLGIVHPFTSRNLRIERADGRRSLAVGVSDPTRLIFIYRTGNAAEAPRPGDTFYLFSTDRHARLLSAGTLINGVFTPVAIDVARARFEAELRVWEAEPISAK